VLGMSVERQQRPKGRARATNDPTKITGHSASARRARDLVVALFDELGEPPSVVQAAAIRRAASLMATAEDMRGRALRGEDVDVTALVKLENLADRAVRGLKLKRGGKTPMPLRERLGGQTE